MSKTTVDIQNAKCCLINIRTNIDCIYDNDEYKEVTADNSIKSIDMEVEKAIKHLSSALDRLSTFVNNI